MVAMILASSVLEPDIKEPSYLAFQLSSYWKRVFLAGASANDNRKLLLVGHRIW